MNSTPHAVQDKQTENIKKHDHNIHMFPCSQIMIGDDDN